MDPNVWGPKLWDTIILCTYRLSTEESLLLFKAMTELIPCSHCLNSYKYFYNKLSPEKYTGGPEKWIWTIHDMVNQKLGKHGAPFSRIDARYKTFTHPVSVYDVFDILIIIATQVKTDESLQAFKSIIPLYKQLIRPTDFSEFLTLPNDDVTELTLWVHLLDCKNNFHVKVGEERISRENAIVQYFDSQPQINAEKIKSKSRRSRKRL